MLIATAVAHRAIIADVADGGVGLSVHAVLEGALALALGLLHLVVVVNTTGCVGQGEKRVAIKSITSCEHKCTTQRKAEGKCA